MVRSLRMSDTSSPSVPPRTAAGLRRRQTGTVARSSTGARPATSGPGGMMRIYTDDSPGIKV
ncbi:hypothetical protein SpCBS45565_g06040 [Spizellomyces sp. 'palustris']|nr:hypothetical protein SpCBS45565_g06040 [Spizellomyces sp. 'palustris']